MLLHDSYCVKCKAETRHFDKSCSVCLGEKASTEKAAWQALTADQKIEALLARISALEEMNPLR